MHQAIMHGGMERNKEFESPGTIPRGAEHVGALVFAPLWEGARYVFAEYVRNSVYYGLLIGSLLPGVLMLLWSYYSAALVLYGAAVVRRLGGDRRG